MKVTKVVIEGFHNVIREEYSFDEINYLHGRNGAGKSTVLQAVQLGLLGYVPGTNKTKQGIFTHSNNHTMAITVYLDDSGNHIHVRRVWTKKGASVSEYTDVTEGYDIQNIMGELELPLFNFDEFTHMTANNLKDWFINYLPKKTFKTNWKSELKQAVEDSDNPYFDITDELIAESVEAIAGFGLEGVEEIRQANSYFKSQLSFMKSELQRKTGTVQSLIHYDDYVAPHSEDELKMLISDTEKRILDATIQNQNKDRIQSIKEKMESIKDSESQIAPQSAKLQELEDRRKELEELQVEDKNTYRHGHFQLEEYDKIINSNGKCVYTGELCDDIMNLREEYIQKKADLEESRKELGVLIDARAAEIISLNERILLAQKAITWLEQDAKTFKMLQVELDSIPVDDTVVDISILQGLLEQYKDEYGKAVANRKYNELNEVVLKDKYRIENTIECLKAWEKLTGVNGLQAKGDYNPFDVLSEEIDSVMRNLFSGQNVSCKFIADGKANSFSFGIQRGEAYVPYNLLSSGEKCLFILSLYLGLLEYSKSPLKLILIDDFLDHLDDENFNNLFSVLSGIKDTQFLFAGVKPVKSENIKVIEL